jgi:hypothetical protein
MGTVTAADLNPRAWWPRGLDEVFGAGWRPAGRPQAAGTLVIVCTGRED